MLASDIRRARIAPFYLFIGPRGVGKSMTASSFARYLLCRDDEPSDEDACKSCRLYASGNHPDFLHVIEPGAAEIRIEVVNTVRQFLGSRPMFSGGRVVLIEDAERLNLFAQNGLLKSLEEPPRGTVLVLTVNRIEALLETIPSRARIIRFRHLSREGMRQVLREQSVPEAELDFVADASGGSPGVALGFSRHSEAVRRTAEDIIEAVSAETASVDSCLTVTGVLDGLSDNAERREFMSELVTALSILFRRRMRNGGTEPLGTVLSVLAEAYKAVRQNVTPELVTITLLGRLQRALRGEAVTNRDVFI